MSHPDQLAFFKIAATHFPEHFRDSRILEVGSLDINGSIRSIASGCEYIGIDIGPGPGVDVVVPGQEYAGEDESFDTVLSAECMEHNPAWRETMTNMVRVLRPGGLFLLTCAAPGRPEHGTSRSSPDASPLTVQAGQEYYRNLSSRDVKRSGAISELDITHYCTNWSARDLYVAGIKANDGSLQFDKFVASVDLWLDTVHGDRGTPTLQRAILAMLGTVRYETLRNRELQRRQLHQT